MSKLRALNFKGDLFATTASFAAGAFTRLVSSLILTRILKPEAYGIITILMSIVYVVELLGDIAVTVSLIRHEQGDQPAYLNTAWTLRLSRAVVNTALVFWGAPLIAALYHAPTLVLPLRVFSLWFVIAGLESMSFPLAIRRKNSRIVVYSELIATVTSITFTLLYCYYSRDYWGMVFGTLLNRLLQTLMSHRFYRDLRPRLQVEREAMRELLRYSRFSMPSSLLTLALSQFDKVIFLRLFDLPLLGVYGLASNIATPIEALISKISQLVLYPRCAHDYRTVRAEFVQRYYTRNTNLFFSILTPPALVGGSAQWLIGFLYDARYAQAGMILQAFMVHAVLLSLASPAEDMLIASGVFRVILVGNVLRAAWVVCGSLAGYYLAGFRGFVYGAALSGLPPLLYYLWLQRKKGFLIVKYELYKVAFVVGVWALAYAGSSLLNLAVPRVRG